MGIGAVMGRVSHIANKLSLFCLLAVLLSIFITSNSAFASDAISGEVTGILTAAESPYLITGITTVPADGILTIEAGVYISFEARSTFEVRSATLDIFGTIHALGTPEGIITFTSTRGSTSKGDWYRIYVGDSAVASFEYCSISSATYALTNLAANTLIANAEVKYNKYRGVTDTSNATIINSTFRNNGIGGDSYCGIYLAASTTQVISCTFESNSYSGIYANASDGTVSDSIFDGNVRYGIHSLDSSLTVERSIFRNHTGANARGLYLIRADYPVITNCSIEGNWRGIEVRGQGEGRPTIRNNWIANNAAQGIYTYAGAVYPTIIGNEIISNGSGVLSGSAGNFYLFYNNIRDNSYGVRGANVISNTFTAYGNNIVNNSIAAVSNVYSAGDFLENYWGDFSGPVTVGANSVSTHTISDSWISYEVSLVSPEAIYSVELKTDGTYATTLEDGATASIFKNLYIEAIGSDPSSEAANVATVTIKSDNYPQGIKVGLFETAKDSGVYRSFAMVTNLNNSAALKWISSGHDEDIYIISDVSPEVFDSVRVGFITTWEASGSPHRIKGYYPGAHLAASGPLNFYAEPGARIEFGPYMGLQFNGALGHTLWFRSIGTPEGRVVFTTSDPDPGTRNALYRGLKFVGIAGGGVGNISRHTVVKHGGYNSQNYAWFTQGSTLNMAFCEFTNNKFAIWVGGGASRFYGNSVHHNVIGIARTTTTMMVLNNIYSNNPSLSSTYGFLPCPYNYWGGDPHTIPGVESAGSVGVKVDPWLERPVDNTSPESVTSIKLFLHDDYADPLGPGDEVGFFDTVFVSVEANDPSSEAYNYIVLKAETESISNGVEFFVLEPTFESGGIYNGRLYTSPNNSSFFSRYVKAAAGDTLRVSSVIDPNVDAEVGVSNVSTWEVDESPVYLDGAHTVQIGNKLFIEPGVTVECFQKSKIIFKGTTEDNSTLYTSAESGKVVHFHRIVPEISTVDAGRYWSGLQIWGKNKLSNVVFQGGRPQVVETRGGGGIFENCLFIYNYRPIFTNSSNTQIRNSRIVSNVSGAIEFRYGSPVIDGCVISGNSGKPAILSGYNTKATITRSTIEANSQDNIKFTAGTLTLLENTIRNAGGGYKNIFLTGTTNPNSRVNFNSIYNESGYSNTGLFYDAAQITIDATSNYWGDPDGPWVAGENIGGNLLSTVQVPPYVNYRPFTSEPYVSEGPVASDPSPTLGQIDDLIPASVKIVDLQGINLNSVKLLINGITYEVSDSELTYEAATEYLTYNPVTPFIEGTVEVSLVSANDIVGNLLQNAPIEWQFFLDSVSPEVADVVVDPPLTGAGTISVTVNFNELSGMDTWESPSVTFTPSGELVGIDLSQTSYTLFSWTGTGEVLSGYGNGTAVIGVSGGRDSAGNWAIPSSEAGSFFIDTFPPSVEVVKPNGGDVAEVLEIGTTYEVRYQLSDLSPSGGIAALPISIYYSIDGGLSYSNITSEAENSGSYAWGLPFMNTTEAMIKVYALDAAGNLGTDEGDGVFEIKIGNPHIILTSPANLDQGVWTGETVEILFNRWMSRASIEAETSIYPAVSWTPVWRREPPDEWYERVVFSPSAPLSADTTYIVTVGAGSIDKFGYPIKGGDYTFTFETGGADATGPVIDPVIVDLVPYILGGDNFMSTDPRVEALISDEASGVYPDSITLMIDGITYEPFPFDYNETTKWLTYDVPATFAPGLHYFTIEASDYIGNPSIWMGSLGVKAGPIISNVHFDGRPYWRGEIISSTPVITATITDEEGASIEASSIRARIGNYDIAGQASFDESTDTMTLNLRRTVVLGPNTYNVTIEASDIYGNPGSWTGYDLKVMAGRVEVVGSPLSYPSPFRPSGGTPATFAYSINIESDIEFYMYDVSGRVILTKKFRRGEAGGRAGYNSFEWMGRTDFGNTVSNGIYVYKIVSDKRVVGTGKFVVHE
jgi:parallel beta-helix repeat protein